MSKSDWWLLIGAVAALSVAAYLGAKLQPTEPKIASDAGFKEQSASYSAGDPECQPSRLEGLKRRKREEKAYACAEAQEEHRLTTNDLIQQRRAAHAAEASAVFAFQQTAVAAWGLALGFVTMCAAIAAALFAKSASDHTESGAKSAAANLDIEIATKRVTLTVGFTRFQFSEGKLTVDCSGALHGNGECWLKGVRWSHLDSAAYPGKFDRRFNQSHVAQGPQGNIGLFGGDIKENADRPVIVGGVVHYASLGRDFETYFCVEMTDLLPHHPHHYGSLNIKGPDWPLDT